MLFLFHERIFGIWFHARNQFVVLFNVRDKSAIWFIQLTPLPSSSSLLPRNGCLLNEVDILRVESREILPARGRGVGVAGPIAVEEGGVGLSIEVTRPLVESCGEVTRGQIRLGYVPFPL